VDPVAVTLSQTGAVPSTQRAAPPPRARIQEVVAIVAAAQATAVGADTAAVREGWQRARENVEGLGGTMRLETRLPWSKFNDLAIRGDDVAMVLADGWVELRDVRSGALRVAFLASDQPLISVAWVELTGQLECGR
jgi:hypothetical protein